jgi:SAM-dependent methyltransferase
MKCVACNNEITNSICTINSYDVYKCPNCGLIYTYPLPDDETLNSYYQGFLFEKPNLEKLNLSIPAKKLELEQLFDLNKNGISAKSFFDFGGGMGLSWLAAKNLGLNSYYYDIDGEAREFVISNFGLDNEHILTNLESNSSCFDYILSDNVIEHVKDPHEFIRRLYNLLNPGGLIVLKTPRASNFETFFIFTVWFLVYLKKAFSGNNLKKALSSVFVHRYWHIEPPRHLYAFSDKSFEKIIESVLPAGVNYSIDSYRLPVFKFSLVDVLMHIRNRFLRTLVIILLLPLIIAELPVILLRYLLVVTNLLSLSGMVVRISKQR